ncbi:hypothetical protein [Actinomadura nitritigenes]|uniref:hypothetical protein n=1 Tax=Actinomadura nitritigenes TaxID=134602 RepID=UPI003D8D6FF6
MAATVIVLGTLAAAAGRWDGAWRTSPVHPAAIAATAAASKNAAVREVLVRKEIFTRTVVPGASAINRPMLNNVVLLVIGQCRREGPFVARLPDSPANRGNSSKLDWTCPSAGPPKRVTGLLGHVRHA